MHTKIIKGMSGYLIDFRRLVLKYVITTDRLLINSSSRTNLKVKVINPINFMGKRTKKLSK